jgi:hypothetical protein
MMERINAKINSDGFVNHEFALYLNFLLITTIMGYQAYTICNGSGRTFCLCCTENIGRPKPGCVICRGTGCGKCSTCEGSGKVYICTRP